jgi:hypothetical protein
MSSSSPSERKFSLPKVLQVEAWRSLLQFPEPLQSKKQLSLLFNRFAFLFDLDVGSAVYQVPLSTAYDGNSDDHSQRAFPTHEELVQHLARFCFASWFSLLISFLIF